MKCRVGFGFWRIIRVERGTIVLQRPFLYAIVLLVSVFHGAEAGPTDLRPLLVTVDDLPISVTSLHPNDAERERITRRMLDVLASHRVRAVGFVTWRNVRNEADRRLLEMWLEAGHELGNHSFNHLNYRTTSAEDYVADVERARVELAELLGENESSLRFFRFPMLREGETAEKLDAMRQYLRESGQVNLCPSLDTQDWSFERPWVEAVRAKSVADQKRLADEYHAALRLSVISQEKLGDRLFDRTTPQVLLLHAGEVGADQWDELFDWLEETGHVFASADEVLSDSVLSTEHRYLGEYGPGFWYRLWAERSLQRAGVEIATLLEEQSAAWSRGDLEGFCSAYREDVRFISPSGMFTGRDEVLARYRKRYPDAAAMGELTLEIIEIRPLVGTEVTLLGDAVPSRVHGASVVARWRLDYLDRDVLSGLTLLVLQHANGRWWIVEDASM